VTAPERSRWLAFTPERYRGTLRLGPPPCWVSDGSSCKGADNGGFVGTSDADGAEPDLAIYAGRKHKAAGLGLDDRDVSLVGTFSLRYIRLEHEYEATRRRGTRVGPVTARIDGQI